MQLRSFLQSLASCAVQLTKTRHAALCLPYVWWVISGR